MPVASPCINICKMDPDTGLCLGCFRNIEEITRWSTADDKARLAVLARIAERREIHDPLFRELRGDCDH